MAEEIFPPQTKDCWIICALQPGQVSVPLFMECKIPNAPKSVSELPWISKVPEHLGSFRFVCGKISWISGNLSPSASPRGGSCHQNLFIVNIYVPSSGI